MVIYKLIKDRWYPSADEASAEGGNKILIFEHQDLKVSLKIVRVGFILTAGLWVFVAIKDKSLLPSVAALFCLFATLCGNWWLARLASWSNSNLKETAWVTVIIFLLVAFAVADPLI